MPERTDQQRCPVCGRGSSPTWCTRIRSPSGPELGRPGQLRGPAVLRRSRGQGRPARRRRTRPDDLERRESKETTNRSNPSRAGRRTTGKRRNDQPFRDPRPRTSPSPGPVPTPQPEPGPIPQPEPPTPSRRRDRNPRRTRSPDPRLTLGVASGFTSPSAVGTVAGPSAVGTARARSNGERECGRSAAAHDLRDAV